MSRVMKDSGIPWIGEIPKDWRTDRAKTIFVQSTTKGNERLVLQSATQDKGVVDKDTLEGVVQVAADADLRTFKTVHIDDFVISLRSFQGGFEICHNEGVISPAYTVFRLRNKSYTGYYRLLFKSYGFIDKINSLTVGIREGKNIQYRDFADMEIPIPSEVEQQRIAKFLDRKCGEIDEAIALQEEFIEELKAYKQSVITEAVTRGLNLNVKFKDSGIDWIGKIPEHWSVGKIGKLFSVKAGGDASIGDYSVEQNEEFCYPVYTNTLNKDDVYAYTRRYKYCGETITVTGRGAIGHAFYRNNAYDAIIRLLVLSPKAKYDCRYYAYFIDNVVVFFTNSAAIGQLSASQILPYEVCVPRIFEQHQIADYLDKKCNEIDSLIAIKQQKIEELKDYKKSIIYEYVTGKKECIF